MTRKVEFLEIRAKLEGICLCNKIPECKNDWRFVRSKNCTKVWIFPFLPRTPLAIRNHRKETIVAVEKATARFVSSSTVELIITPKSPIKEIANMRTEKWHIDRNSKLTRNSSHDEGARVQKRGNRSWTFHRLGKSQSCPG